MIVQVRRLLVCPDHELVHFPTVIALPPIAIASRPRYSLRFNGPMVAQVLGWRRRRRVCLICEFVQIWTSLPRA